MSPRSNAGAGRRDALLALASGVGALAVAHPRVSRGLCLFGDSAVMAAAAQELGVPQPSGYPLLTLLGKGATLLPWGSPLANVHALSALAHAASVGLVCASALHLGATAAAALGGALFVGLVAPMLLGSLYAETFPLLVLASTALGFSALRFAQSPSRRRALELGIVAGLGASHHQMLALAVPGAALLCWPALRRPLLAPLLGPAVLLPLLFHGALLAFAARDPHVSWGDLSSVSDLVRLVSRADYGGPFSPHLGQPNQGGQLAAYLTGPIWSLSLPGLALAGLGAVALARTHRRAALAGGLTFVISGPLFAVLNDIDVSNEFGRAYATRFATMSVVTLGPFVALGLTQVERWLLTRIGTAPAGALVAAAAAWPAWLTRDVNLSQDARGAAFAQELVESAPDGALILTTGDASYGSTLQRCGVERLCGQRIVLAPGQLHLDWRVRQLRRRHPDLVIPEAEGRFVKVRELIAANLEKRPVFVMPALLAHEPPLQRAFDYEPQGLLLRVLPAQQRTEPRGDVSARTRAWLQGCAGCRERAGFQSPLEQPVRLVYVQALLNHAAMLQGTAGDGALARSLRRRAERLDPVLTAELD